MARVSVSGQLGAGIGGNQGTTATASPRPTSGTNGSLYGAEVRRAKWIAGGLFLVLVIVHAQRGGES